MGANDTARAWLDQMMRKYSGAPAAPAAADVCSAEGDTAPVRPSEMISGSSGVQYSYGDNTNETSAEGQDFGSGSRENAEANDHDQAGGAYNGEGSHPMQSPDLGGGGFALRYGIGFLCANYASWNDLADVAAYAKPKSAYLAAFKGLKKQQQYLDPKSAAILKKIAEWVSLLVKDLAGCGHGELVVSFQGHGANGSFYGVDEVEIKAAQLLALAKAAEAKGVSLTLVMDACFSGAAVPAFQDHAADRVDQGITEHVEGAGQVCSEENNQRAEALRTWMAHARALIQFSAEVGTLGDQLHAAVSRIEANNRVQDWDAAMALNVRIIDKVEAMRVQFLHNKDVGSTPDMGLDAIETAFDDVLAHLRGIEPQTSFDYRAWTASIGRFQDRIGDGANRIIRLANAEAAP